VYIRPEYHERLLRIVQLTREEKTTLYSYIDNILEQHFNDFGTEIQNFFNERNKPIFKQCIILNRMETVIVICLLIVIFLLAKDKIVIKNISKAKARES
jgi:hypothetical protein